MPTITEIIASLTDPGERARRKAQELVTRLASQVVGAKYTYGGVTVTVTSAPTYVSGLLSVTVTAKDSQNRVVPVDNPYQFYNPPVSVVVTPAVWGTEPLPSGHGTRVVVVTPAVTEERPLDALKAMLGDAVILKARQLGWTG